MIELGPRPRLAAVALIAVLVAACAGPPLDRVDLTNTSWHVAAVDGTAVATPITLTFAEKSEDETVTVHTPCGSSAWGVALDTDGNAISFGGPDIATDTCDAAAAAATIDFVSALRSVNEWSVEDEGHITFKGARRVSLTRGA